MPKPAVCIETVRPEQGGERLTVEVRAGRKGTGRVVAARSVGTGPGGWYRSILLQVRASIAREAVLPQLGEPEGASGAAAGYAVVDLSCRW